jgi:hypothetical protein
MPEFRNYVGWRVHVFLLKYPHKLVHVYAKRRQSSRVLIFLNGGPCWIITTNCLLTLCKYVASLHEYWYFLTVVKTQFSYHHKLCLMFMPICRQSAWVLRIFLQSKTISPFLSYQTREFYMSFSIEGLLTTLILRLSYRVKYVFNSRSIALERLLKRIKRVSTN